MAQRPNRLLAMTVVLKDEMERLVRRLMASGRYENADEAVCAGLKKLEECAGFESFPPGSLQGTLTNERNAEELGLLRGSSLMIENE